MGFITPASPHKAGTPEPIVSCFHDCDAALMVEARREKLPIVSYDRDFAKAHDVTAVSPIEWIKAHPPR